MILEANFDKLKDNIVDVTELKQLVDKGGVFIKKVDGKIIFIQIYEFSKNTVYSRMTWVDKMFRKPKYYVDLSYVIYRFLKDRFTDLDCLREYFWINKAIKNYKIALKRGVELDGLSDYIFVYDSTLSKG